MAADHGRSDTFLTLPHIAVAIFTYFVVATAYNFLISPKIPTNIPWMGYGKGWLAQIRNFAAVTNSKEWALAGYEKHSRNDEFFVLPATLGSFAEIVIPPSQMAWMFDQPDNVLSVSEAHYDILYGDYSFIDPIILKDPYHEHVTHKSLVRNLNAIIPDLIDEVPHAIAGVYGTNTEKWIKLDVMDSFMRMIPSLTNRMLVGSLCRNRKYLNAVANFTMDCIRIQGLMVVIPGALQPIAGRILSLANHYHYWLSSRFTIPLIKQRISDMTKKDAGHPDYITWKEPNDFITWSYRTAQAENRRDEMQPTRIAQRILPLNFASNHTTTLTAYEALVNILHADPGVMRQLREEAYRILQEEGGYTRNGLSRMHRIDSAIRESQRLSPFALTLVHRKVVAKEGVTTPQGIHFPYGTIIACPWTPIAADTDIFEKPDEFDAFRFSRPREEYEAMTPEEKEKTNALKLKQGSMVTTGFSHLPFGHGRHAWCVFSLLNDVLNNRNPNELYSPGRFFVSHELKIVFSHLLLHYDFKPIPERPKKLWVIRYGIPLPAQVEARYRKSMWTPSDE
ncbi:hypothetical protein yc1106_00248 [Curvularia clavata]|uniref:Cytochrome P450 n=1 Tax=Curvularia clavata TaxID=95742 RepID=A0A9Q8YZN8_CURCL|nr:hypothetical protein yc1106_00248 [Curvularia clavata]